MKRLLFHFKLWSHIWVFCGFLALAWTERFGTGLLVLAVPALCLSPFIENIGTRFPTYKRLWNGLSMVYLLILPFDLMASELVLAVTHLLIFIQMVKLLNRKENKDYIQMYLMCFFQLLAASVLTTSSLFSVALVLFMIAAVWTLALFHLKLDVEKATATSTETEGTQSELQRTIPGRGQPEHAQIIDANIIVTNVAVSLATVMLAIALFYTVPRLEAGFLSRPPQLQEIGFTEEVELTTFGQVFSNSKVVMKVEMPQYPNGYPGELYWRAVALDHYDGRRWVKLQPPRTTAYTRLFELHPDNRGIVEPRSIGSDANLVEQIVYIDSLETSYLFGLPEMKRVLGDFGGITWDREDESWTVHVVRQDGLRYRVYSRPPDVDPDRLRRCSTVYPDSIAHMYLQLPLNLDRQVRTLALDITKRARNPYDKLMAIQSYLERNYVYSLTAPVDRNEAPLEDFLFRSKVGHCEFYATAMAVMLRCCGVPARLASGFRGGQWNEFGKFYSVQQDFAHVWVEAYFPGAGWAPFDPSPRLDVVDAHKSWWAATRSFVSQYSLALQMKWYKYVIGYSNKSQWAIIETIQTNLGGFFLVSADRLRSTMGNSRLIPKGAWQPPVITIYLASVAYLLIRLRRYIVLRKRRSLAGITRSLPPEKRRAAALYADMLFAYARRGIIKRSSYTPVEFLSALAHRPAAERQLASELTHLYYLTRFGDRSFARTDERRSRETLSQIEHSLRR